MVASGETLAVKSVIGVVTLAKAPESGGSATNTSLKVWLVPKPERLPCGETLSVPSSVIVPALIEAICVGVACKVNEPVAIP